MVYPTQFNKHQTPNTNNTLTKAAVGIMAQINQVLCQGFVVGEAVNK